MPLIEYRTDSIPLNSIDRHATATYLLKQCDSFSNLFHFSRSIRTRNQIAPLGSGNICPRPDHYLHINYNGPVIQRYVTVVETDRSDPDEDIGWGG